MSRLLPTKQIMLAHYSFDAHIAEHALHPSIRRASHVSHMSSITSAPSQASEAECGCVQVAQQANTELLQLPDQFGSSDTAAILAHVSTELNSPAESTRLEALHWVLTPACDTAAAYRIHLQQCCTLLHVTCHFRESSIIPYLAGIYFTAGFCALFVHAHKTVLAKHEARSAVTELYKDFVL